MKVYEISKNRSKRFREVQSNQILENRRCVFTIIFLDENREKLVSLDFVDNCKINSDVLKQKVSRFLPRKIRESWRYASVSKKPIWSE